MIIRLLIALLLLAAVPAMAAEDQTPAAPRLAQQQVRDTLLEQLQRQVGEAQTRADEAERRERDAEIQRLADQARQAQARAGEEEQLKLAAQHELSIQEAKAELQNSAYSRLEILIGVFGALITAIVVFFAWNTKETAVAAAKSGVEDIRDEVEKIANDMRARRTELDRLVAKARQDVEDISKVNDTLQKSPRDEMERINTEEAPKSVEGEPVTDLALAALAKLPENRTVDEYRTIISYYISKGNWDDMLAAARLMRQYHDEK